MMILSFADLLAAFDRAKIPYAANAETQSVEVPAGAAGPGLVLLLRWSARAELVELLLPLGLTVPAERLAAALDAINRINHALVMPGMGLDPRRNALFYRLVLPRRAPEGGLSEPELRAAMQTAVNSARDFREALRQVADEGLAAEQVVARAGALRGT